MIKFKDTYNSSDLEIDDIHSMEKQLGHKIKKLSRNESVFGPSPKVKDALKNFSSKNLQFYPELNNVKLKSLISSNNFIKLDNVYISSGSDDFIYFLSNAILGKKDNVLLFDYTFRSYNDAIKKTGAQIVEIDHDDFYRYNLNDFIFKINENTKIIVLVNPNMPTGQSFTIEEVMQFVKKVPKNILIIIDHAYCEYAQSIDYWKPLYEKLDELTNVVVLKTFSKLYALASARIGYAMSSKNMITNIENNIRRLTVSSISIKLAEAALRDTEYYNNIIKITNKIRNAFQHGLTKRKIKFIPSRGNFVLIIFKTQNEAQNYADHLLNTKNLLIRKYKNSNRIRITIGTEKNMKRVLEAFDEISQNR